MTARRLRNERGLTLTELTIVGLLATIVMVALTGFYIHSQQLWTDASTQALAQRDAALLVTELRHRINEANDAAVSATDNDHDHLSLTYLNRPFQTVEFAWNVSNRKMHLWIDGHDQGPVVDTPVAQFKLQTVDSPVTRVDLVQALLSTAAGDSVGITSSFALRGR